ncbi:MAG: hypothetical protein FRX48_02527 [Lasallia pustulata]|uniref:Uncharacterized protein n=1 Tax=Lasallia pustulata TaxID=136370 RepID=A0A5M8PWY9_9LECA|nr:MAG: hypothetical protein FRX48_02527 [Lasallia pustulata]
MSSALPRSLVLSSLGRLTGGGREGRDFFYATVVAGLIGYVLAAHDPEAIWAKASCGYTEAVAGVTIIAAVIWFIPSCTLSWPVDLVLSTTPAMAYCQEKRYCTRQRHACLPVPQRFVPKVDHLIRLANICCRRPVVAPRLWRALRRRQQQYNRQVTAYTVRVQDRHKRASKPRSSVDATLLMEQLQRTNTTLKHILDSMHYHFKLPSLSRGSDADDDGAFSANSFTSSEVGSGTLGAADTE